jgi:hypothetical protein
MFANCCTYFTNIIIIQQDVENDAAVDHSQDASFGFFVISDVHQNFMQKRKSTFQHSNGMF